MASKRAPIADKWVPSETGTVIKNWQGRTHIALVYPNRYHVGMSNLGFQVVYQLFNRYPEVLCERAFLPEPGSRRADRPTTLESGRPLGEFDLVAFSVSFENDYPNLLTILSSAGLPLDATRRRDHSPLVLAGGVACLLNPEPLAPFIDAFLIGEAEALLPALVTLLPLEGKRERLLQDLALRVPGCYVPRFYRPSHHRDGTLSAFDSLKGAPLPVIRGISSDLNPGPACNSVTTPNTIFGDTLLIEVGRGCPHGCRFCSAGYIYRPPRFHPISRISACLDEQSGPVRRVGLVGAAVSDLPGLEDLCRLLQERVVRISFSSLRADALSDGLIESLRQSRVKTATIAPDAGSERMRTVINKGLSEDDILTAAESLVAGGIPNLKLYFMIGLPGETLADVDAIGELCKKIKHRFLKSSRTRGRIGEITVSLNCFVPKPATPFQWAAMNDISELKMKIKRVKERLKTVANLKVHADVPRWAIIQGLLARGDRRVAEILSAAHRNRGNWAKTLKESAWNPNFYTLRERPLDELLPWDFIDHGVKKAFLQREYRRAQAEQTSRDCVPGDCKTCGVC